MTIISQLHFRPQIIIQSKINAPEWKLEVERVTPHLRIQLTNDNKDWRIHLESMTHYFQVIKNLDGDVKERLKTLKNDIEKGLEKIVSREKYINTQFEGQVYRDQMHRYCLFLSHINSLL